MVKAAAITGCTNKVTKLRSFLIGITLSLATLFWGLVSWAIYELVINGLDSMMMGYEVMPQERHGQIRSYFIRESLPGNLAVAGILLAIGIFLGWRWRLFFRDLSRRGHGRYQS